MSSDKAQRIALVTGSTRGIGLETVRLLARRGVRVGLAGRRYEAAAAAAESIGRDLDVEAVQIDITDERSIADAAEAFGKRHGRLDILINNAGILIDLPDRAPSEQPIDIWRRTFETNLFGMVAVTDAFLPLLRRSNAGRIVNLSSSGASMTLHNDPDSAVYHYKLPAYNASKSAVNAWTVHLAYELRDTPIRVNAVDPGYVRTDMNGGAGQLDVTEGAETSIALALVDEDGPSGGFFHRGRRLPW